MKKVLTLAIVANLFAFSALAQQLLPAMETFSHSKPGYLITVKGERIEFTLKDLDRKKGLIINVEGKTLDGKKFEYKAEDIAELALAPSELAKVAAFADATESVLNTAKTDTKGFRRDLVYFFQEVTDAKKKRTTLMQLLNPTFSDKIRIYHDPFAAETGGISVGNIQVTGGLDKSYYIKTNGKVTRLYKKDYDDEFKKMFGTCPELLAKYKNFNWRDLNEHVFFFQNQCK